MTELNLPNSPLKNVNKINIIVGKNGCGKSRLIRSAEIELSRQEGNNCKYLSPERGGMLEYNANIEQHIGSSTGYLSNERRKNQVANFKLQSIANFKKLKSLVNQKFYDSAYSRSEQSDTVLFTKEEIFNKGFNYHLNELNSLLDNITLKVRSDGLFDLYTKLNNEQVSTENISSGESELITLGIECLIFREESDSSSKNYLFLDEPDVHLHPDLQIRLMAFLKRSFNEDHFCIFISTHSTSILGAFSNDPLASVALMKSGDTELTFHPIDEEYQKILPIFGAHPLSNVFNESPILLVEGGDDERVWQKAVRTSKGKIKVFPCEVGTKDKLTSYENRAKNVLESVYDSAVGYSLRDGDNCIGIEIEDMLPIQRFRLNCYSVENLLLTDEVLLKNGLNWENTESKINQWLTLNTNHQYHTDFIKFKDNGFNRRENKLKEIRNIINGDIIEVTTSWEITIGKVLGTLTWNDSTNFDNPNSIYFYLGKKLVKAFIPKQ